MDHHSNNNDSTLSLLSVLKTLYRWRKPIIWVTIVAGVGTAIISILLPNYYKSTTVFFAASPDQAQPEILFNKSGVRPYVFGNDNDIDRLLTIAKSADLLNFVVDQFNLYQHYDIDSTHAKAPYKVRKKFLKYYDVTKNSKDAIELSFEDKDPEFAAALVNATREKIDEFAQRLVKNRHQKAIETFEQNITT